MAQCDPQGPTSGKPKPMTGKEWDRMAMEKMTPEVRERIKSKYGTRNRPNILTTPELSDPKPELRDPELVRGYGYISRKMTMDEFAIHERAVSESLGFDVPTFPDDVRPMGMIKPVLTFDQASVAPYVNFAIKQHNVAPGENLQLVEVLKWNVGSGGAFQHYITFTATDATAGGPPVVYQTLIRENLRPMQDDVLIFRRRPEPPAAGSSSSACNLFGSGLPFGC